MAKVKYLRPIMVWLNLLKIIGLVTRGEMKWKGEKRRFVGKFGSALDGQISLKCPNIPSIYYDNGDFLPVLTTAQPIVKAPQLNTFKVIFRVKNFFYRNHAL